MLAGAAPAAAEPPRTTDDRLLIELVVKEPEIVTPTGLAVDERGRIWLIENNTHERPGSYHGYPSDRIRIFDDFDRDGHPRRVKTFVDGFRNSMSLALRPDGWLYFATRSDIYRMRVGEGDVLQEKHVVAHLETKCTYPHNALAGLAFDALGNLYVAMGENLGVPYKLTGADGTSFEGGGEGGNIYRCRPDGRGLVRISTGFWNPFALTFDAFGRLFAVDNDPDARGPCRLLHIIRGGDYGYRYRNGRRGLHPFTAWNGELPGTLPMVAGTAEAPSGIVAYESAGLPADYRGDLLVTSWGDHVIERFRVAPRGASFTATSQAIVRGGEDFRPVAIATAPDGALYVTDWVDKSYPVHGKGRIWRIRMKRPQADDRLRVSGVSGHSLDDLCRLLGHPKREIKDAATTALATKASEAAEPIRHLLASSSDLRTRLQALWTAARWDPSLAARLIEPALHDASPEMRAEAVRVLGEELRSDVTAKDGDEFLRLATIDPSAFVRMQAILELHTPGTAQTIVPLLGDRDPFLAAAALEVLGRSEHVPLLRSHAGDADPRVREGVLLALRRSGVPGHAPLPAFLTDADAGVRRAAIQWVGEERLHALAPLLEQAASRPPVTRDLFEAYLASSELLRGGFGLLKEASGQESIARVLRDASKPPAVKALALRMLQPDSPALNARQLASFLGEKNPELQSEAARTLAMRGDQASQEVLRQLAAEETWATPLRAEAVLGLAQSAKSKPVRELLLSLLSSRELCREALRSLRGTLGAEDVESVVATCLKTTRVADDNRELAEQILFAFGTLKDPRAKHPRAEGLLKAIVPMTGGRPQTAAEWRACLQTFGDRAEGARVFFHPRGPRCFACHRIDGRGGVIGPDLSLIGRSTSRQKLIESILEPSKEIAPAYVSWLLTLRDGRMRTGVIVEERFDSTIVLGDAEGKLETFNRTEIEERQALPASIMPANLPSLMTRQEFLDLLAFLESRK
jgi:putative membrane-bound dehydrogenase-like protein